MTAEDLKHRLMASARTLGWPTSMVPEFERRQFRGRSDESQVSLPDDVHGLRLGDYPVLVSPVALVSELEMQSSLRKLHNQMVIARSYMKESEVINAHLILCASDPSPDADWRTIVDLAERDETVCRKIVWIPDTNAIEGSYQDFLSRTFLASPWTYVDERHNAPLDNNQGLAKRILVEKGLTADVAEQWIATVETMKEDPDAMVVELVKLREGSK
ncbi:ABC-three component system middle component 1 [Agrobacterium tumefaciens]|uniref:ABC-three component system middle component 1 n=1 Tax=Agrobacterium tumefaciens TaxID=358 RepID=UPI003BA14E86